MPHPIDRRNLFRTSAAAIAAAGASGLLSRPATAAPAPATDLPAGATILFQGDSITDVGRDRNRGQANDPRSLGNGYPMLIASGLLRDHAEKKLNVLNRGISGNKVPDLAARWQAECIDLKPNVLSILIGVNDIWHMLNGRYEGTVKTYASGYQALLEDTMAKLPDTRIVICEPFVLRCGAVGDKWFPEFTNRLEAARRVAADLSLQRVAFQEMFDEAIQVAPPEYWAGDGVHPTLAGHALMAETWRKTVDL